MTSFLSSLISRDPRAAFPWELSSTAVANVDGVQIGNSHKKAAPEESASVFWGPPDCAALRTQAQKLKTMRHPSILTFLDSIEAGNTLYLITERCVPLHVDFCSTEPQHLLAAYTKQQACIIDIETGATVLNFDFGEDASVDTRIKRILSHPTMNTTIIGGSDRKIRYFDNSTGQQQHSVVAHVEAISSLAIDSNGLHLLSGSDDGRERFPHRKMLDSAVTCVAIHSSKPLIGSAGADSLAKVYTTESRHV